MSPTIKEDRHEEVYRSAGGRGTVAVGTTCPCGQGSGVSHPSREHSAGGGRVGSGTEDDRRGWGSGFWRRRTLDRVAAQKAGRGRPRRGAGPQEAGASEH